MCNKYVEAWFKRFLSLSFSLRLWNRMLKRNTVHIALAHVFVLLDSNSCWMFFLWSIYVVEHENRLDVLQLHTTLGYFACAHFFFFLYHSLFHTHTLSFSSCLALPVFTLRFIQNGRRFDSKMSYCVCFLKIA